MRLFGLFPDLSSGHSSKVASPEYVHPAQLGSKSSELIPDRDGSCLICNLRRDSLTFANAGPISTSVRMASFFRAPSAALTNGQGNILIRTHGHRVPPANPSLFDRWPVALDVVLYGRLCRDQRRAGRGAWSSRDRRLKRLNCYSIWKGPPYEKDHHDPRHGARRSLQHQSHHIDDRFC